VTHPAHHNERSLRLHLCDEAATAHLGATLAATIEPGLRIYLRGDLGAGKTTLVRGLLRALGFQGRVKSPSYALVELYVVSRLNLYHFDFFRFRDPKEWSDAGFREYFSRDAVCLVEWPEKAGNDLPPPTLDIFLSATASGRDALLTAHAEAGEKCLKAASELKSPDGFS
jgi:tRNA threonylcarbamoyladenosine biosynthesis protein TsaE